MIGNEELFVRNAEAVTAMVDEELVALDVASGACYGLNDVATVVWNNLATASTLPALCGQLQQIYDVDDNTCHEQVSALLEDMLSCKLISRA